MTVLNLNQLSQAIMLQEARIIKLRRLRDFLASFVAHYHDGSEAQARVIRNIDLRLDAMHQELKSMEHSLIHGALIERMPYRVGSSWVT